MKQKQQTNQAQKLYEESLELILSGQTDLAAHKSRLWRQLDILPHEQFLYQQLISTRLALKTGNFDVSIEALDEKQTANIFLAAEITFVKGLVHLHRDHHKEAGRFFLQAAHFYQKTGRLERMNLSIFNTYIANSQSPSAELDVELTLFTQLACKCERDGTQTVLFLCLRQQSYILYKMQKYSESLKLMTSKIKEIEVNMSHSDFQLAVLHIVDCALWTGDALTAFDYFGKIKGAIEERVRLPLAYIEARFENSEINLQGFETQNPHWKWRYENWRKSLTVSLAQSQTQFESLTSVQSSNARSQKSGLQLQRGLLLDERKRIVGRVRRKSLEGRLLACLQDGPRSRVYLCEILWPAYAHEKTLEDRFHQLLTRLNRKCGRLVEFDGQNYRLVRAISFGSKAQ